MDQTDKPNTSKAEILSTIERLKAMTPADPAWQLAINKALAKEEDRHRAIEAGCDAHVIKPISRELLLEVVRRYLRR